MRLNSEPFELIKNGKKTIELRLYDEKRKAVSVGDEIEFIHFADSRRTITAEVVALHVFSDFSMLYKALPLLKCGYTKENISSASHKDMDKYYPREEQERFGVIGIEIKLI